MSDPITRKLEQEPIGRLLLQYAIPAVIGTMVNSLYNIVDRIFIGQGMGPYAIAGLTLTFPILMFLQAFGMLVGAGAATRVSIFLGRKEHDMAEKVAGNAFILILLISVCTIIPALWGMETMLRWFGGSDQTMAYATDYLYIIIPGNLLMSLSFGFNTVMRASGYPKKAMVMMMIGALLNVVLDPVFIFWLDMGIRGAAIASIISMVASTLFVMNHFFRGKSIIRLRKKYLKPDAPVIWSILTIGISPFAMQLAGSLVNVILNHSLKTYGGDLTIGANGIITSIGLLLVMLIVGICQGMQPIVGFNYGAGNHQRVQRTLQLVIITATCVMGAGWLGSQWFPEWIVKGFTQDPELTRIAANGLRISLMAFFIVGSQISISQFFQSIGLAWIAMFLSLSRQILFLIPAILLLPPFLGLDGVWYASPLSDLVATAVAWGFLWWHVKNLKNRKSD